MIKKFINIEMSQHYFDGSVLDRLVILAMTKPKQKDKLVSEDWL
jgi:hypothetical protein